jgi:aminoglycoside/choline kinase family phosphotransferase
VTAETVSPTAWIERNVARRWPGARSGAIVALKGDASARRFWRVSITSGGVHGVDDDPVALTAIAIDLGPDDLPLYARALRLLPEPLAEPPWLNVHKFLNSIGVPVPELYIADVAARMILVEDVGELSLFDAAGGGDAADLYRLAADLLLRFHLEGTRQLEHNCIAYRLAYDKRLFRWELEQFIESGVAEVAPGAARGALTNDLGNLARRLGRPPRVFSHRDYHGHNLFVQRGSDGASRLRVIDFQDALMAPAAQDLAVLMTTRDTSRIITPRVEQRVLDYYHAALIRKSAATMPLDELVSSYRLCVLQHALKVIGRFTWLERNGKRGYASFIPYALAQARRMLADSNDFPALRVALSE